jgi:hypothetical protein
MQSAFAELRPLAFSALTQFTPGGVAHTQILVYKEKPASRAAHAGEGFFGRPRSKDFFMAAEHDRARHLLQVIRKRIQSGEPPFDGYIAAAASIGLEGDYNRHMGQVCSRVDAASFVTGWPMLAVHMIRKPDGSINPESFSHSGWENWLDEVVSVTTSHKWTVQQVDEIIGGLDGLPDAGARALWAGFMRAETRKPGFIRWNLHRKLKGGPP